MITSLILITAGFMAGLCTCLAWSLANDVNNALDLDLHHLDQQHRRTGLGAWLCACLCWLWSHVTPFKRKDGEYD